MLVSQKQKSQQEKQYVVKEPTQKDKMQGVFEMMLASERLDSERTEFLRKRFDEGENRLLLFLNEFKNELNYMVLKQSVEEYIRDEYIEQSYFRTLKEALDYLQHPSPASTISSPPLTSEMVKVLRNLDLKNDQHLFSAWESYQINRDQEDLLENLTILYDVKKTTVEEKKDTQEGTGMFSGFSMTRAQ